MVAFVGVAESLKLPKFHLHYLLRGKVSSGLSFFFRRFSFPLLFLFVCDFIIVILNTFILFFFRQERVVLTSRLTSNVFFGTSTLPVCLYFSFIFIFFLEILNTSFIIICLGLVYWACTRHRFFVLVLFLFLFFLFLNLTSNYGSFIKSFHLSFRIAFWPLIAQTSIFVVTLGGSKGFPYFFLIFILFCLKILR